MTELPAWRYHATQGAKLFLTADEITEAEAQGWADSPAAAAAVLVEALSVPAVYADMPDDGVIATLEAAEDAVEQGETGAIEEALEDAEEAIEKVQAVVSQKHKRKTRKDA